MPSIHRRAALGLVAAGGVASCADRLSLGNDENTSPADRRVSPSEPDAGEATRRTRSFANDPVTATATPPRDDPEDRWRATDLDPISSVVVTNGVVLAGSHEGCEAPPSRRRRASLER
ncbi:hypothetical protein [Natronococcus wangiae]|uniref:hypothetical protein n=1 Tax=Natronococcus wangiae TaxID=3068275 RepID=UPI00273F697A|nr:hypothetical protein [Natronococcus sp. AD5]